MSETALVTGAAGFIGSHLVDRLLADGWTVIGVDSFEDYYPRAHKERNLRDAKTSERFTLIEENVLTVTDAGGPVHGALAQADVVFHLAAQAGVRASWGDNFSIYTDNNILGTQMLLEACKSAAVRRFVYASSSSVYGDTADLPSHEDARCAPFSPYAVSKLAGEHLCYLYRRNFGIPSVSLRFFTVYGPRQRPDMAFHRFIRAIMEGRVIPVYGDGTQTRDFTYVSDIVEGVLAAAGVATEGTYNLGGGSRASVLEVLALLGEVMGQEPRLEFIDKQAGDVRDTSAWLDRSRSDLGYAPRVSTRIGLENEVAWLREFAGEPGFPWGVPVV